MIFQREVGHVEENLVPVRCHDRPDTVTLVRVVVGVVRAGDDPS
jgi:hypothetical protein